MKKIFLVLCLSLSLCSCTKKGVQDDSQEDLVNKLPDTTKAYLTFDTSSESYMRYKKSPWIFDINDIQEKFLEALQSKKDVVDPSMQVAFDNIFEQAKAIINSFGLSADKNAKADFAASCLFINASDSNPLGLEGGFLATSAADVNLSDKLGELKNYLDQSLTKNKPKTAAKLNDEDLRDLKGFSISQDKFPLIPLALADHDNLAILTSKSLAEQIYTPQENNSSSTKDENRELLFSHLDKSDKLFETFVDIDFFLKKISQFEKDPNKKKIEADFPVRAFAAVSAMPSENLMKGRAVTLIKAPQDAKDNILYASLTPKSSLSAIKSLPQDLAFFLNIDGSIIERSLVLAEENKAFDSVPQEAKHYITLIESIKSLSVAARPIPSSPMPELAILFESDKTADMVTSLSDLIVESSGTKLSEKEIQGVKVYFLMTPFQITVYLTEYKNMFIITTSDKIISDIIKAEDTLFASIPSEVGDIVSVDKSFFYIYGNYAKIASFNESLQSALSMFQPNTQNLVDAKSIEKMKKMGIAIMGLTYDGELLYGDSVQYLP